MNFMEAISWLANSFMNLFQAGGENFLGWVTGIIPMVICLMTAVNAVIKLIGEGRFVEEKYKPAYYDAAVSFVHPVLGLGDLAVRYFFVGLIVILLHGIVTERIYLTMRKRAGK